jgi:hypothetical protein
MTSLQGRSSLLFDLIFILKFHSFGSAYYELTVNPKNSHPMKRFTVLQKTAVLSKKPFLTFRQLPNVQTTSSASFRQLPNIQTTLGHPFGNCRTFKQHLGQPFGNCRMFKLHLRHAFGNFRLLFYNLNHGNSLNTK